MSPHNTFVTLTYDDEHLPPEAHLDAPALQRFFKRLRKMASDRRGSLATDRRRNIRYFASGEYGEQNGRPHYHALIFNADFTDKYRVGQRKGKPLFESPTLSKLWPYGGHRIGEASVESAAYIAQYSLKKQGTWRGGLVDADGVWRPPPFLHMSKYPPIGTDWLAKYHEDLTHGYLVAGGRQRSIPRQYLRTLLKWHEKQHGPAKGDNFHEEIQIRKASYLRATLHIERNNQERREAQEHIHKQMKEKQGKRM